MYFSFDFNFSGREQAEIHIISARNFEEIMTILSMHAMYFEFRFNYF
jgi:hypothetical protein